MAELYMLPYSPWSEKARWALDHHGLTYQAIIHTPVTGIPRLRWALGKITGRVTVPAFVDNDVRLMGAETIARYAESHGFGPALFPEGAQEVIAECEALSEKALQAERALVVRRTLADPAAQLEAAKGIAPDSMPGFARALARFGANRIGEKYDANEIPEDRALETLTDALVEIRSRTAGRTYVLDGFSYADIALAVIVQGVMPVENRWLRLGKATRECWTTPLLAAAFEDVVFWRDEIYRKHRRRVKPPGDSTVTGTAGPQKKDE